jgi:hypothetical protein
MKTLARSLAVAVLAAAPAGAVLLPVANAGFEDLYLGSNLPPQYGGDVPTGSFPTGPPPAGWTAYFAGAPTPAHFIGVLNPGTTADHAPDPPCFPAGAPEGDNVVLLYGDGDAGGSEYGVQQQLADTLQPDTLYTLTVEVGNIASCAGLVSPYLSFFDLDGFPGYRVQLLAGGVVVAEDAGTLTPGEGQFQTATVQLSTGAAPPQQGLPLAIRLVNRYQPDVPGVSGLEVDFDDVRLDASPAAVVPVAPWAFAVLSAALAAAGIAMLRARARAM